MITTREAATELGITARSVTRLITTGVITGQKYGRDYLIEQSEIERYKRERRPAHRPRKDTDMSYSAGTTNYLQTTDWSYLDAYSDQELADVLNAQDRSSQRKRAELAAAGGFAAARPAIDTLITNDRVLRELTDTRRNWETYPNLNPDGPDD